MALGYYFTYFWDPGKVSETRTVLILRARMLVWGLGPAVP